MDTHYGTQKLGQIKYFECPLLKFCHLVTTTCLLTGKEVLQVLGAFLLAYLLKLLKLLVVKRYTVSIL